MLHLCFAGGLRVSELVALPLAQVCLQGTPSIRVHGKRRKERCLPLWKETAADLRAWLAVRGQVRCPELFANAEGAAMTRAGFEYVLDKHVRAAAVPCPALAGRSVTPHQLRHSCAVVMLQATRDIRKVALWLGHADIRTTEAYLRVNPTEKLEAVEAVLPPGLRRGRFKAPDALIAALLSPATPTPIGPPRHAPRHAKLPHRSPELCGAPRPRTPHRPRGKTHAPPHNRALHIIGNMRSSAYRPVRAQSGT